MLLLGVPVAVSATVGACVVPPISINEAAKTVPAATAAVTPVTASLPMVISLVASLLLIVIGVDGINFTISGVPVVGVSVISVFDALVAEVNA